MDNMGASSRSHSQITQVPRIGTWAMVWRLDSTAILSERAVGEGGEVFYSDGSQTNADRGAGYITRAGVANRVHMGVGMAQDLLKKTPGEFDIIMCDVDKHYYPECFEVALPRVRKGGLLVADNVLWHGRVGLPPDTDDTRGILEWNRLVTTSPQLATTIVPLRDGVSVSFKL